MTEKRTDDFQRLFEAGTGSNATPEEPTPWDAVWSAHARGAPLRVQILGPAEGGLAVAYRGLNGLLLEHGAPWIDPPAEADAWVLRADRDRGALELVAWSPTNGPATGQGR